MADNTKTSWLKEMFSNLKRRFCKKRPLTDAIIESEMQKFIKEKNYTVEKMNNDMAAFQVDFIEYLEKKDYNLEDYEGMEIAAEDALTQEAERANQKIKLPAIRSISEKLNKNWGFNIFSDTTVILPGLVVYVVDKIEPTEKIPYTTYKPAPRIIVSVHNNGVNGGTVFITYEHKLNREMNFQQHYKLVSEYEVIYSPLTKTHAEYICRLLNFQSKQAYNKAMIKLQKQKQR